MNNHKLSKSSSEGKEQCKQARKRRRRQWNKRKSRSVRRLGSDTLLRSFEAQLNPSWGQGVTDGQQWLSEWRVFRLGRHINVTFVLKVKTEAKHIQSCWVQLPGASLPRVSSREFTITVLTLRVICSALKRKTSLLVYLNPSLMKLSSVSWLSLSSTSTTFHSLQSGLGSPSCTRFYRLVKDSLSTSSWMLKCHTPFRFGHSSKSD